MEEKDTIQLNEQELHFCELYVHGGPDFAGKGGACHKEVFGNKLKRHSTAATHLLTKPHIKAHLKEMMSTEQFETETIAVKLQVAETLKAVMEETSKGQYIDRFGVEVSPAPLRAVAVNAAKALMEIYPIKHVHETRLRVEGADGNVIFNVIVPQTTKPENED